MANEIFSGLAQILNKIDELEQDSKRYRRELQEQREEISSLRDLISLQKIKYTSKVANIWNPDEYISSNDKRLWGESKLFRSQWALQYAIRELGCPFAPSKGCKRKRVCKASTLEEWINNPDVRDIMEKTKKMRANQKKQQKPTCAEHDDNENVNVQSA